MPFADVFSNVAVTAIYFAWTSLCRFNFRVLNNFHYRVVCGICFIQILIDPFLANSNDHDQRLHGTASDLGLHCLHNPIKGTLGLYGLLTNCF